MQLKPPPVDVISALEADLVGNVVWGPIFSSQISHNLHRAFPGPSKIGSRTVLQYWMRIYGLKCTYVGRRRSRKHGV